MMRFFLFFTWECIYSPSQYFVYCIHTTLVLSMCDMVRCNRFGLMRKNVKINQNKVWYCFCICCFFFSFTFFDWVNDRRIKRKWITNGSSEARKRKNWNEENWRCTTIEGGFEMNIHYFTLHNGAVCIRICNFRNAIAFIPFIPERTLSSEDTKMDFIISFKIELQLFSSPTFSISVNDFKKESRKRTGINCW